MTPDPAAQSQDARYVVEYYYKVRWGHQEEFLRLFRKNHVPVLAHETGTGRILAVLAEAPRYHATEDGRWDYRVTIAFRDAAAAAALPLGEEEMRALFPDKDAFEREERRRFEILDAHWDVPLVPVSLT